MTDVLFPQWRNAKLRTKYPFADDAPLRNASGDEIPSDLITDALVHPVGGSAGMWLSSLALSAGRALLRIGISDPIAGEVCFAVFDPALPTDDLALEDPLGRAAGILVGSATGWDALRSSMIHDRAVFTSSESPLVPSVCVPVPSVGVDGFLLDDGTVLTGDVWLVGLDGIILRAEDGTIRVDAIGDPYALLRDCQAAGTPLPSFCGVKTINQIPPDAYGNWILATGSRLAADNVLRITPVSGGVEISLAGVTQGA